MSTPYTSPAPDAPTGSSNPVSLKSWFTKITTWIAELSPSTATVYDSKEQPVTLAVGIAAQAITYSRIGHEVAVGGALTPTGLSAATWHTLWTMPSGYNLGEMRYFTTQAVGSATIGASLRIQGTGEVQVYLTATTSATVPLSGIRYRLKTGRV